MRSHLQLGRDFAEILEILSLVRRWIRGRLMRLVRVFRASEVRAILVTPKKALVSGPRVDHRTVQAEVFTLPQPLLLSDEQHRGERPDHRILANESLTALSENHWHLTVIINRQTDEPTKTQVVPDLPHQLTFGPDAFAISMQFARVSWKYTSPSL
jgi:hypothetical protein